MGDTETTPETKDSEGMKRLGAEERDMQEAGPEAAEVKPVPGGGPSWKRAAACTLAAVAAVGLGCVLAAPYIMLALEDSASKQMQEAAAEVDAKMDDIMYGDYERWTSTNLPSAATKAKEAMEKRYGTEMEIVKCGIPKKKDTSHFIVMRELATGAAFCCLYQDDSDIALADRAEAAERGVELACSALITIGGEEDDFDEWDIPVKKRKGVCDLNDLMELAGTGAEARLKTYMTAETASRESTAAALAAAFKKLHKLYPDAELSLIAELAEDAEEYALLERRCAEGGATACQTRSAATGTAREPPSRTWAAATGAPRSGKR